MRQLGQWVLLLCLLALGAGVWIYFDYQDYLTQPLAAGNNAISITLKPGDSINTVRQQLEQAGVLDKLYYFTAYARLSGAARKLQVGEYTLKSGMTLPDLLQDMVTGKVRQYSLTIPEGWTFAQMLEAIARHPKLEQKLSSTDAIMTALDIRHPSPEGLFFPDTYLFPSGTSDIEFLRRAYQTMQTHLDHVWSERQKDLPLENAYQALILASIIEKETGVSSERREIAGVFVRRLQKGMLLQTDPTVIYGIKDFDGNITRRHLRQDHPYNTYVHKGLPPTPIALPGLAALEAAVNPLPGDTLYFVATGDGGHKFSRTLREHQQAVRQYQLNR